jgi:hypothetical protein
MAVGGGAVVAEADILALIDGAIEDYAVSGDAMRWTPDDGQTRTAGSPWITTDEAWAFVLDNTRARFTPTQVRIGGVDVTPHVSSIEMRGAEPHLTVIDEVHVWRNR